MPTFPLTLHIFLRILQYSLSDWIPLPTASTFLVAHCHLFFLVPTLPLLSLCSHKSLPCALLHTRLVRSNYGRAVQPPAHTLGTHSPLSLSLYQLGINLLKQRASWRAAHRGPCEVLPLHRSTLLPILRTTHSSNLFPTALATKQIWAQGIGSKTEESKESIKQFTCGCKVD